MSDKIAVNYSKNSWTLVKPNGQFIVVHKSKGYFPKVVDMVSKGEFTWEKLEKLMTPYTCIMEWGNGKLVMEDGDYYIMLGEDCDHKTKIEPSLVPTMENLVNEGAPIEAFVNFMIRLMKNPSKRSRTTFYGFVEKYGLHITDSGMVRGYKAVDPNFKDKYTRKVDNRVGVTVPMLERNDVSDDPEIACAFGYHFGSIGYVRGFAYGYGTEGGDKIIYVETDPANIVCVPIDCSQQKVRTTQYTVVAEYTGDLPTYIGDFGDIHFTDEGGAEDALLRTLGYKEEEECTFADEDDECHDDEDDETCSECGGDRDCGGDFCRWCGHEF